MGDGDYHSMTTIRPTDRPMMYCVTGAGDPITGTTHVGELTGVNPALTTVADADENAFIAALPAEVFPLLPESGWLEADGIYRYGDGCVIVRQAHERTHYAPSETPNLFIVWREGAGDLEWVVGESVLVGTRRTYDGVRYECITGHTTEYAPPSVPALWRVWVDPDVPAAWVQPTGAQDSYRIGDRVTHAGWVWECTAGDAGGYNSWEPGEYGWTQIEPI